MTAALVHYATAYPTPDTPTKKAYVWTPQAPLSWAAFIETLDLTRPGSEKDCGGYVPAKLDGTRRTLATLLSRTLLALDVDNLTPVEGDYLLSMLTHSTGWDAVAHSTYSSTEEAPRYRVVVRLSRPVVAAEYEPIARWAIAQLGIPETCFDMGASTSPIQFMYRPSVQPGQEFYAHVFEGAPLDVPTALTGWNPTPPAEAAAPYNGKPYEDLPQHLRDQADLHVTATINTWADKLTDAAGWGAGVRDEKGRGWEKLATDAAWSLALLAVAPWTGLTVHAAGQSYTSILPRIIATDPAIDRKFTPARVSNAAAQPAAQAPWERHTDTQTPDVPPSWDGDDYGHTDGLPPTETPWEADTPAVEYEPFKLKDVAAALDADYRPLEPTRLKRRDGLCLLYEGRTHSFSGESGCGKSWLAQWEAAETLRAGGRVLYLDYESSLPSILARLKALGATNQQLIHGLDYTNPEGPAAGPSFESLLANEYAYAVVDGVTESLNLAGFAGDSPTNNNDAVTKWHATLPKRIAIETGAAVVQVDHVTKSKDGRGGYAIGGQAKRASITGAAYLIEPGDPFGRGRAGTFKIKISKDREGFILGALEGDDGGGTGSVVGIVTVDSHGERVSLSMAAPKTEAAWRDETETAILAALRAAGTPPDGLVTNAIRAVTGKKGDAVRDALARLVLNQEVILSEKGQGKYYRIHPSRCPESDVY